MTARYGPGDRVQVGDDPPVGHHRTPRFVQGRVGWVHAHRGAFPNPESRAHGGDGLPKVALYTVRFEAADLWDDHEGGTRDAVYVDLYEPWLNPVE